MASFAKDLPGKMVAIWFPISAFIALGLEHSVANMCHGLGVRLRIRLRG